MRTASAVGLHDDRHRLLERMDVECAAADSPLCRRDPLHGQAVGDPPRSQRALHYEGVVAIGVVPVLATEALVHEDRDPEGVGRTDGHIERCLLVHPDRMMHPQIGDEFASPAGGGVFEDAKASRTGVSADQGPRAERGRR